MTFYCQQCGGAIPDKSAFCNSCGARQLTPDSAGSPNSAGSPGAAASAGVPPRDEPEQDLWKSSPSARAFLHYWLLTLAVFAGAIYLAIKGIYEWRWAFVIAAVPVVYTLFIIAAAKLTTRYRLTTQRIFVEKGFLNKSILETELVKIDDVAVNQNILQRIFGVGVVKLAASDADESMIEIVGIENPIYVKETIRAQVRKQQSRILRTQAV
ncbi:MAG: PH domain-containing protein [Planctomycetes bacterium]|nr:PH domain-containing protein [Planctomycetota bacterium]